MAKRNYTEEAYEQIRRTIEEIDNEDLCPVKDFISDLIIRICQFLGMDKMAHYQDDMQSWYNKVLDSHDSTMTAVDEIFQAVETVDGQYEVTMEDNVEIIVNFRNAVNCLRDVISDKISLTAGKKTMETYLSEGKDSLRNAYDAILVKMELNNFVESGTNLITDFINLGMAFSGLLVPAEPVDYALKGKKFADTFFAFLGDAGAFGIGVLTQTVMGVGSYFGMDRKNYLDFRMGQLNEAEYYRDRNSVSDWFGGIEENMEEALAKCPEDSPYYKVTQITTYVSRLLHGTSETLDIFADGYEFCSDIKDIDELFWGKEYTVDEFNDAVKKGENLTVVERIITEAGETVRARGSASGTVGKIISNTFGIPVSGWDDPTKAVGNAWKTMGTIWSYTDACLQDPSNEYAGDKDWMDVLGEKIKAVGTLENVLGTIEDVADFCDHVQDQLQKPPASFGNPEEMIQTAKDAAQMYVAHVNNSPNAFENPGEKVNAFLELLLSSKAVVFEPVGPTVIPDGTIRTPLHTGLKIEVK